MSQLCGKDGQTDSPLRARKKWVRRGDGDTVYGKEKGKKEAEDLRSWRFPKQKEKDILSP